MRFLIAIAMLLVFTSAFAEPRKLSVVVSFSILEDMTKQLGGDYVEVHSLVPRGGDTHTFEPRPADAKKIKEADLVIVNGLGFDDWMRRLVEASGYTGDIVVATTGIQPIDLHEHEHEHSAEEHEHHHEGHTDPHAWHSLKNAAIYAQNISTALAATDKEHAYQYADRLTGYLQRIRELDLWVQQKIRTTPLPARVIIVPHNTFAYYARDYRVMFHSLQGASTEHEASAKDMAGIIRLLREKRARAVFSENLGQAQAMEQIAKEAGIAMGGVLYTDALSDEKGEAGTYLEMIRVNTDRMMNAILKPVQKKD